CSWAALLEVAAAQGEHLRDAEPTAQFLRLLAGALASGRAHVACPDGTAPAEPKGWGWRDEETPSGSYCRPLGRRVGWLDGPDLYLEPESVYAEVQELARHQGESLPTTPLALRKRLQERGLLASTEQSKLTNRRTLEGRERAVLHLRADCLM